MNPQRTAVARRLLFSINSHALWRPDPLDAINILSGCTKRYAFEPPRPGRTLHRRLSRFTSLFLKQLCARMGLQPLDSEQLVSKEGADLMDFTEWLRHSSYGTARRDQLKLAYWGQGEGDTEDTRVAFRSTHTPKFGRRLRLKQNKLWRRRMRKFTAVKSHCKDETYPLAKAIRLINSRHDYAKGFLGPIFHLIEHVVCNLPWFIKFTPVKDRPSVILDRIVRDGATYAITDYSSFEAHFTPIVMRTMELPLYRHMLSSIPKEQSSSFLGFWSTYVAGNNRINLQNQMRCNIEGVRMSGEMNTSLANGWCNLCLFMFSLWDQGATWTEMFDTVSGFVEGDDGLFRVPKDICPTTEQMASYGFKLKIETTTDIRKTSFCGMVFTPKSKIVVTDPIIALLKLGWVGRKYIGSRAETLKEVLLSKALSAAYQYNGCPIISPVCLHIAKVLRGQGVMVSKRIRDNMGWWEQRRYDEAISIKWDIIEVDEEAEDLVSYLFDIDAGLQRAITSQLLQWSGSESFDLTGLPQRYEQYEKVALNYIHLPTSVNHTARRLHYETLWVHYSKVYTLLPDYSFFTPPGSNRLGLSRL